MRLLKKLKYPSSISISKTQNPPKRSNLYSISIKTLAGKTIELSQFKGKYILFVNVASECGFTPQYRELQKLHKTYEDKLTIIGVPCNQFGNQEPGAPTQIRTFCDRNFGVTFLLTEKLAVKGSSQHPLYGWLTKKELNGLKNSSVKWNFQKYLIDEKGELVDYFYSITEPMSSKITKHLK